MDLQRAVHRCLEKNPETNWRPQLVGAVAISVLAHDLGGKGSSQQLLLDEPAEEAVLFPLRAVIGVGNTQGQIFEDSVELRGSREVDRLAQVI
jgi:hypothetical protein